MPEREKRVLQLAVFVVLTLATVLLGVFYDAYEPVGPELLVNADFRLGFAHWTVAGPSGAVELEEGRTARLHSSDPGGHVSVTQSIPHAGRFKLLRLSGEMRTEGVVRGEKSWQAARLILSSFDGKGQWVPAPSNVISLIGDRPRQRYEGVFRVTPQAEELQVSVQLERATGTLWVENLSLRSVLEKPGYAYLQTAALTLWGLFLFWLLVPLIAACRGWVLRGVVVVSLMLILGGTLLPGKYRQILERDAAYTYETMSRPRPSEKESQAGGTETPRILVIWEGVKKLTASGHFAFFGLLGLGLAAALPMRPRKFVLLDVGMLAGATEVMQFFVEGRTALFGDWLLDLAGAGCGLVLVSLWRDRAFRSARALGPQERRG